MNGERKMIQTWVAASALLLSALSMVLVIFHYLNHSRTVHEEATQAIRAREAALVARYKGRVNEIREGFAAEPRDINTLDDLLDAFFSAFSEVSALPEEQQIPDDTK